MTEKLVEDRLPRSEFEYSTAASLLVINSSYLLNLFRLAPSPRPVSDGIAQATFITSSELTDTLKLRGVPGPDNAVSDALGASRDIPASV